MADELVLFEERSLEIMQKLSALKAEKENIEKFDAELRDRLQKIMTEYGVTSFKNEYVTISNVAESETITVDLNKLKEKEPECYEGLIADYPKVTKRKAYVRITVK